MTTDIAIHPVRASLEDFDWRVSIAQVSSDGPFSMFSGVDRHLVVLDGKMTLRIEDQEPVAMDRHSPALAFPGDHRAQAELKTAMLTDLNVMVRRGSFSAELFRWSYEDAREIELRPGITMLVATGKARVGGLSLERFDAAMIEGAEADSVRAEIGSGQIHGVRIWRAPDAR